MVKPIECEYIMHDLNVIKGVCMAGALYRHECKNGGECLNCEHFRQQCLNNVTHSRKSLIKSTNNTKEKKMHKLRKGATFIEVAVFAVIFLLVCGGLFLGCFNKYVMGNKQFVDFKQSFNYAYIDVDGKSERIEITAWKDWKDSDAIQFVSKDGRVYYTHLSRVVLSDK